MVLGQCLVSVSARLVKVTFCVFWCLYSADETYRLISSPYIFACTACSAIQLGTEMNLSKTYKICKKNAPVCCELMELLGYLRFPAKNSIGGNVNLSTYFQQDALPRFPWLPYMFVDINDLRMRINLQHHECFPLTAVGFKSLFIECLTPHSARAILLTTSRIVQVCLYGWTLQTFQTSA